MSQSCLLPGFCKRVFFRDFESPQTQFFSFCTTRDRPGTKTEKIIVTINVDERLKAKSEGSTCLVYTVLREGLEHLKIETRLVNERFVSVMGECDLEAIGDPSKVVHILVNPTSMCVNLS